MLVHYHCQVFALGQQRQYQQENTDAAVTTISQQVFLRKTEKLKPKTVC